MSIFKVTKGLKSAIDTQVKYKYFKTVLTDISPLKPNKALNRSRTTQMCFLESPLYFIMDGLLNKPTRHMLRPPKSML